jgi:hypothetical protein
MVKVIQTKRSRKHMSEREHHPLGFSRADRRWSCPWSLKAEEGLEDIPSEEAVAGTRIHEHLEKWTDSLVEEDQEVIERARTRLLELGMEPLTTVMEETLPLLGRDGVQITFGTLDARRIVGRQFTLVDFKSGWKQPAPIVTLKQLGAQGAALMQKFPILTGGTCIALFARLGTEQHLDMTRGDVDAVVDWYEGVREACGAATKADINPGAWCQYCMARDTCDGPQRAARELLKVENVDIIKPEQVAQLLDLAEQVQPMIDLVRKRARNLLRDGAEFPPDANGKRWRLKDRRGSRTVDDPVRAHEALSETLTAKDFLNAVKVQVGKLEKLWVDTYAQRHGVKKVEAKALFEKTVGAAMRRQRGTTVLTKE